MADIKNEVKQRYLALLAERGITVETKIKGKAKHYFTKHGLIIVDNYPSLNSIIGLITRVSDSDTTNMESFGVILCFLKALMSGVIPDSFYDGLFDAGLKDHTSAIQTIGGYGIKISAPQSGAVAVVEIIKDNGKIKFRRNLKAIIHRKEG